MGRIDKWSEGEIGWQGEGGGIRHAANAGSRLGLYVTYIGQMAATGGSVSYGGNTGLFNTIHGVMLEQSQRQPVAGMAYGNTHYWTWAINGATPSKIDYTFGATGCASLRALHWGSVQASY